MMSSQTITQEEQFWKAVKLCLVEFHSYTPKAAGLRIAEYIKLISPTGPLPEEDLVYHYQPFHLAADLANSKIEIEEYREEYDAILQRVASAD